jgi:hypothetical protein
MRAFVVAAAHMQQAKAGLPHLPEGDLLLAWHAPNLSKNYPQPEYGIWHRLTECQGKAHTHQWGYRRMLHRRPLRLNKGAGTEFGRGDGIFTRKRVI